MNLQDLNLVELNAQEVQEVEGGGWLGLLDGLKYGLSLLAAAHEGCTGHSGSYINQGGVVVATYKVH